MATRTAFGVFRFCRIVLSWALIGTVIGALIGMALAGPYLLVPGGFLGALVGLNVGYILFWFR